MQFTSVSSSDSWSTWLDSTHLQVPETIQPKTFSADAFVIHHRRTSSVHRDLRLRNTCSFLWLPLVMPETGREASCLFCSIPAAGISQLLDATQRLNPTSKQEIKLSYSSTPNRSRSSARQSCEGESMNVCTSLAGQSGVAGLWCLEERRLGHGSGNRAA